MRVKLGSVCTKIGSGVTPRGGKNVYQSKGVSLIRSQNVLDMEMTREGLVFISDEQAEQMSGVEVQSGDILLNITGDSVARVSIVNESFLPARVNQHVSIIRPNQTVLTSSYLQYYLQMQKKHLLVIAGSNSTRNALTKEIISDLEIDIPSIERQNKICKVLDIIQKKVSQNNTVNNNLAYQSATVA